MRKLLAVALLAAPTLAQANAVPGLDITMYEVTDLAFYGRRGPAYPNGEAGFMVGHSWCNAGTVNLPWVSQSGGVMVDQYPRIAFLLVRESGGRMVQITGQGHSKHSPTAFNFSSGPCAPCNAGGGGFFFVGCSDTYGSGTNASQHALGPNNEINPWLGTWNPQGSYFDRGDPAVTGPQAIDSVRSLTFQQVQAFDSVKNRMIVREQELLVPGALYYSQVQGVVQGEPGSARANNVWNRQVTISGTGGTWNTGTAGGSVQGSVLTRWSGANVDIGGNGNDDGTFAVAVKVTGPTAGLWHYEYAIHNVDNFRGGASFRIPLAPGAVVQNTGFRDVDADPLNDWTVTQTATELAFNAVGTNALDWNTIYNCWFDCSIPPGAGNASIDQARPGAGALTVLVGSEVPSGLAFASKHPIGSACGACTSAFYELFPTMGTFDLAGRSMTMSLNGGTYTVAETGVPFVPAAGTNLNLAFNSQTTVNLPFALPYPGGTTTQLRVCSSGYVSPVVAPLQAVPTVAAFLQGVARWAPLWHAIGTLTPGSANVFFDVNATRAILTWNAATSLTGTGTNTFQIQFFPNGTVHVVWQNVSASTLSALVGWTPGGPNVDPGPRNLAAELPTSFGLCATAFNGLALGASAQPVLGTTVQWELGGIAAGTGWGALIRSLTEATPPIDLTSAGMPGCSSYVAPPIVASLFVSPGSSVQVPESLPSSTSLIGVTLVGQAVTYSPPLTPLGLVASNGMVLTLGM